MASVHREVEVAAAVKPVWDALRDVGHVHERLVPGFLTDCRMEGNVRVVTFANGMTAREPIVDVDDERRRVAWAAVGEPFTHYSASLQAFESGEGRTRLVWIADLLPDELASQVDDLIEQGLQTMKRTLERTRPA